MKNKLLLPRKCLMAGWILLPFATAWIIDVYIGNDSVFPFLQYVSSTGGEMFGPDLIFSKHFQTDFNGELSILTTLASLFMIAFARENQEDEYISSIRLRALQVSIYANYIILAIAGILIYGTSYIIVLQASAFSILLIFILVFNYNLYIKPRFSKSEPA